MQGLTIFSQVNTLLTLELIGSPVHNSLIPVITAEVCVTVRGLDLDHAFTHFQDRDIECASTQIEDQDRFVLLLIEAICQGGGCGLVDDAHHFKTGDLACILRRLALAVIKIRRDGDHGLRHRLAKIGLGIGLKLGQNHRADFLRAVFPVRDRDLYPYVVCRSLYYFIGNHLAFDFGLFKMAADKAFDGIDRIFRIDDGLALGGLTDQTLIILIECHDRRA